MATSQVYYESSWWQKPWEHHQSKVRLDDPGCTASSHVSDWTASSIQKEYGVESCASVFIAQVSMGLKGRRTLDQVCTAVLRPCLLSPDLVV